MESRTYTIQEVSQKAHLPKHTLRFWEKALEGVIVPMRTQGGQRRYTRSHIALICEVKRLKRRGMSLEEIKKELTENLETKKLDTEKITLDILAEHIAEAVKSSLYDFFSNKNER